VTRPLRRELERLEVPEEHEARERAWELVQAAFAEREPIARSRARARPVVALAVVLAVVAAAISPAGEAVLTRVREAIGIERSAPALFSLPAQGRVLVAADSGSWIVQHDGSKRRLGLYREASPSPFGRFVVTARRNELAALEPDGDVRGKLSRPRVRLPRWGGSRTDTRIAYLSGSTLRVVAGDGTADHRLARRAVAVAPAWRPGAAHVLAYVRGDGFLRVVDADRGTVLSKQPAAGAARLEWVADRLLVLSPTELRLYDDSGFVRLRRRGAFVTAALAPRAQAVAAVRVERSQSVVELFPRQGRPRRIFAGTGRFTQLAWSPDGRWLLVAWRDADQWLFIRVAGARKLEAVSNISAQFESSRFPSLAGWCCS
jgi:hypothetical protein